MKTYILLLIFEAFAINANNQKIQFASAKQVYKETEVVKLEIKNTTKNKLYYFISAEILVENNWKEFTESILDFPQKTTIIRSIKKSEVQFKNISINDYWKSIIFERGNCSVRFVLHSGNSDQKMSDTATVVVTINRNN